mmetsp:Transcript_42251/g.47200  ORF Transcript_42251/g.47200 Transcript_42251/m.47200 type:complete len:234 (+) Transcript_42251:391-1092(+)|eukprot:CAMPEP_0170773380 /NCGR_PEP_ID=MMETSP0733-20121128/9345_1 /TAXON_ID=186038 /ORGANISM="Fragilariopsis kerguelensis, Strain L26-C5" /LENGTH=233 /DNA_ID=CAMNT_0011115769 /DNA_START=305 /DNA_END=1006 /DNA_ORIENTATION=+
MNFSTAAVAALVAVVATTTTTTVSGLAPVFTPDSTVAAYGLPGKPFDTEYIFDPLGLSEDKDYETMKQYREAELQHGRVAMLGALGMLITEEPIEFHPLFETNVKDIGPAIRHLDEIRAASPFFFEILVAAIGGYELNRALIGWQKPGDVLGSGRIFNEDYFPGDVGFDPLRLAPADPEEFYELHTKELNNGRLAMIGWAGMVAQELVNGKEIFVNAGLAENRFDPSSVPIQF